MGSTQSTYSAPRILIYNKFDNKVNNHILSIYKCQDPDKDKRFVIYYKNGYSKYILFQFCQETLKNDIYDFVMDVIYQTSEFKNINIYTNFLGYEKTIYNEKTIDDFKDNLLKLIEHMMLNSAMWITRPEGIQSKKLDLSIINADKHFTVVASIPTRMWKPAVWRWRF